MGDLAGHVGGEPAHRPASSAHAQMHSQPWSEEGLNLAVRNEANRLIERHGVRVRRDDDAFDAPSSGDVSGVPHQRAAYPVSHPVWVDEQILEIEGAVQQDSRGKPDDVISLRGNSGPTLGNAIGFHHERLWMGEQSFAVTPVGQRGPDEHVRQRRQVGRNALADPKYSHPCIVSSATANRWPPGAAQRAAPPSPGEPPSACR